MVEKKYSYDRFDSKGSRVGQAVCDILESNPQPQSVEETLEEMGKGIANYIQEAAEKGCKEYEGNFFLLHLFKKVLGEHGIENTMLQKATCFKDRCWEPHEVMEVHPNSSKSLYEVDQKNGVIKLIWSVPGWEDCKTILKNPHLYDRDLVSWVKDCIEKFPQASTN
ncbi:MAG: hypothetical protein ACLFUW_00285 [Bacteroidales bacterium]